MKLVPPTRLRLNNGGGEAEPAGDPSPLLHVLLLPSLHGVRRERLGRPQEVPRATF